MTRLIVLLSFLLLATLAASVPTNVTAHIGIGKHNRTASIKQHQVLGPKRDGPKTLKNVYRKYNITVHHDASNHTTLNTTLFESASNASNASTAAAKTRRQDLTGSDYNEPTGTTDIRYLSPIYVGSSTQPLYVQFDTGSSDFWVMSSLLDSYDASGHDLYTLTGTQQADNFDIGYGDGSFAAGPVYSDVVGIGGIALVGMEFGAAQNISPQFQDEAIDGILGMGIAPNSCQPNSCENWMNEIGGYLEQDYFTATLRHQQPGQYDFGFINTSLYTGDLTTVAVADSSGYWTFTIDGYNINYSLNPTTLSFTGLADTGTTFLLLPSSICDAYYSQIPNAGYASAVSGYVFPCSSTLPDFTLTFGGADHTMSGGLMLYTELAGYEDWCFGGMQSQGGFGYAIVGEVFLKSQFVVFAFGANEMAWAQQA